MTQWMKVWTMWMVVWMVLWVYREFCDFNNVPHCPRYYLTTSLRIDLVGTIYTIHCIPSTISSRLRIRSFILDESYSNSVLLISVGLVFEWHFALSYSIRSIVFLFAAIVMNRIA